MKIDVPAGHQVGMRVPKGGSSCAKCKYVNDGGEECSEPNFIKWNDDSRKLPEPANEYCCDFYTWPTKTKSLGEQLAAQKAKK
jgi:hypothetical protein